MKDHEKEIHILKNIEMINFVTSV